MYDGVPILFLKEADLVKKIFTQVDTSRVDFCSDPRKDSNMNGVPQDHSLVKNWNVKISMILMLYYSDGSSIVVMRKKKRRLTLKSANSGLELVAP